MAHGVSAELENRIFAIADTIGTTVYLEAGGLKGQVSHLLNFSGVKVKHTLTIIASILTADRTGVLVRGPGNLLFFVLKSNASAVQCHVVDASKLQGDPAEMFNTGKLDQEVLKQFMSAIVVSFSKNREHKWEPHKKAA